MPCLILMITLIDVRRVDCLSSFTEEVPHKGKSCNGGGGVQDMARILGDEKADGSGFEDRE